MRNTILSQTLIALAVLALPARVLCAQTGPGSLLPETSSASGNQPAQKSLPSAPSSGTPSPATVNSKTKGQTSDSPAATPNKNRDEKPAEKPEEQHSQKPLQSLQPNESSPDVFLLPDRDGALRRVLGYPYEDFAQARKRSLGVGDTNAQPRFTIQSLNITGAEKESEKEDLAELSIKLTIRLNVERWVGVPLNLSPAVLVRAPAGIKGNNLFLEYLQKEQGYVLWLRGPAGAEQTVTLSMLAPLEKENTETVLRLALPRATTTQFVMDVSAASAQATVAEGVMLLSTTATETGGTRFKTTGPGHPFELRWNKPLKLPTVDEIVFQVTGEILSRISGPSIETDARLTVRSLGSPFDSLRVQLPEDSEFVPSSQEGYSVSRAEDEGQGKRFLDVKFPEKTQGPVVVQIKTRSTDKTSANGRPIDLSGFHVSGALQETGHLAVSVDGEWSVLWPTADRAARNIRRVEVTELSESLRSENPRFAFEYFRLPFTLPTQIIQQRSHRRVDSEYVIRVGARRADLDADFRFVVTGSKVFDLALDSPDWTIDEVGPPTQVEEFVIDPETDRVHVRLRQAARGEIPLTLKAHLEYQQNSSSTSLLSPPPGEESTSPTEGQIVKLSLPLPIADARTPGTAALVPDNNVILTPLSDVSSGLVSQATLPRRLRLPLRQQEPLTYRVETPSAQFSAQLAVQSRAVRASMFSRVSAEEKTAEVSQTLRYHVEYEPVERLKVRLPSGLLDPARLEAIYNGERLPVVSAVSDEQENSDLSAQIALPGVKIGRFQIELRYSVSIPSPAENEAAPIQIPFILPLDCELTEAEVEVTQDSTQQITIRPLNKTDAAWEKDTTRNTVPEVGAALRVRLSEPGELTTLMLPLELKTVDSALPTSVFVDRYWVQSHISNNQRRDRVVLRMSTSRREIYARFPPAVDLAQVMVLLNGKPLDEQSRRPSADDSQVLEISLPAASLGSFQLELSYQLPEGLGSTEHYPAQLVNQSVAKPVYWQLALPSHVHLLDQSHSFVSENLWRWNGFGWSREPSLSQERLERWSGATQGSPLPVRANVYLLSSTEPLESLQLLTTTRAMIVLGASGATLLIGFVLVYSPILRKPIFYWTAAGVILVLAILYPEPAILFGQAGALGVVLGLSAAVLRNVLARRSSREILISGASSVVLPSEATVSYREQPSDAPSSKTITSIVTPSSPSP